MCNRVNRLLLAAALSLSSMGAATAAPYCVNAASDPDGDGWGWENGVSCIVQFKSFRVTGSVLKDANGNVFIARGINNPFAWADAQSYNVLGNLAARNTNLIRVVLWKTATAARLDQILTAIENLKMVAMVEIHDGTSSNDTTLLQNIANWYVRSDILPILKKHERYLMINIANEWGDGDMTPQQWAQAYKGPITTLRNAGFTTTLVIDNPGWGQNAQGGLQYGASLVSHDPRHNLLFSTHAYGLFNNPNDIYNTMTAYKNANLAMMWGEFGYNYNNGNNNLHSQVDAAKLMDWSQQLGIGYIAWSTGANSPENAWLDLLDANWAGTTAWGNLVWYGTTGSIKYTAQKASIFP